MKHNYYLKTISVFVCGLFLSISNAASQKNFPTGIIKGQVVDAKTGEPVPYATIRIGQLPKYIDVLKALATDDNGKFEVRMPPASYLLNVSFVGYKNAMTLAEIKKENETVEVSIPLHEGSVQMQEVEVKPLVVQTSSEIIYNLDQDPDRETSTLYDLIDRVPMIGLTPDGKMYVENPNTTFLIVRNGKEDALFDNGIMRDATLKSLPAKGFSAIKIKLIPDERYGNYKYVVSIDTDKKNRIFGLINQNYDKHETQAGKSSLSSYLVGSYNKLRFRTGVEYTHTHSPRSKSYLEQHFFSDDSWLSQQESSYQTGKDYTTSLIYSYDLGARHFITGKLSYNYSRSGNKQELQNQQFREGVQTEYSSRTSATNWNRNTKGELNYQYDFEKPNRVFNVIYNFDYAPGEQRSDIQSEGNYPQETPLLDGRTRINQHTLQTHYSDPLSAKWKLETGLSYLYRDYQTKSDYTTNGTPLPEKTSNMESSKHIFTHYLNLGYTSKKISARIKLNTEYLYDGKGTLIQEGENPPEYVSETGFIVTPNIQISTFFGKDTWIKYMSWSYNWYRKRPNIRMMTTQINYTNPHNIYVGNPALSPQNTHQLLVSMQTIGGFNFGLGGSIIDKRISSYWYKDEAGRVVNTYANAGSARSASFVCRNTLIRNEKNSLSFSVQGLYDYSLVNSQRTESLSGLVDIQTQITLFSKIAFIPQLGYIKKHDSGMENRPLVEPFYFQCSSRFQLFKKRMEVEMGTGNLFQTKTRTKTEINTPDFAQYQRSRINALDFQLTLTWHLGSFKVKPIRSTRLNAVINDIMDDK